MHMVIVIKKVGKELQSGFINIIIIIIDLADILIKFFCKASVLVMGQLICVLMLPIYLSFPVEKKLRAL
jgi:hypothetical protein